MKNKQKEWHPATKPLKKKKKIFQRAYIIHHVLNYAVFQTTQVLISRFRNFNDRL
jgi:hypothetical protein